MKKLIDDFWLKHLADSRLDAEDFQRQHLAMDARDADP
jgi:hypothetical protein